MKKFNLEEAKAGKPVCTRNGRKARIICFDAKNDCNFPIVALVSGIGGDYPYLYNEDGEIFDAGRENFDLMIAPIRHERWIFLYRSYSIDDICASDVYDSLEDAKAGAYTFGDIVVLKYQKVEWEEYL